MKYENFKLFVKQLIDDPWNAIPLVVAFVILLVVGWYVKAYLVTKGQQHAERSKSSQTDTVEEQAGIPKEIEQSNAIQKESPIVDDVIIEFDRASEFIGGVPRVETLAFLLNREHGTSEEKTSFTIRHEALPLARKRLSQLSNHPSKTEDEEKEFRHLILVKDFLSKQALPQLERAIDIAVNDDRVRNWKKTQLNHDKNLTQFILGLRDVVFGIGTPVYWGELTNPAWIEKQGTFPYEWNVWWRGDMSLRTTVRVPEEEDIWIHSKYRCNLENRQVFSKETAFDVYALTLDIFYGMVLPAIIITLVIRWPAKSEIPLPPLDLTQWVFSVAEPEDAILVPRVGSSEFHKLRDSI